MLYIPTAKAGENLQIESSGVATLKLALQGDHRRVTAKDQVVKANLCLQPFRKENTNDRPMSRILESGVAELAVALPTPEALK